MTRPSPSRPEERGHTAALSDEMKMEAVSRMASPKQVEFLEDLSKRAEIDLDRPAESLTARQASAKIDDSLERIDQVNGKHVETRTVRMNTGREWVGYLPEATRRFHIAAWDENENAKRAGALRGPTRSFHDLIGLVELMGIEPTTS